MTWTPDTTAAHTSVADTRPPRPAACPPTSPQTLPSRLSVTRTADAAQPAAEPLPHAVPLRSSSDYRRHRPGPSGEGLTVLIGTQRCQCIPRGSRRLGMITRRWPPVLAAASSTLA